MLAVQWGYQPLGWHFQPVYYYVISQEACRSPCCPELPDELVQHIYRVQAPGSHFSVLSREDQVRLGHPPAV